MTIVVSELRRRFGGVAALDGVELSVRSGEFVALLGASGSGKTTLLRALAGLEFPDAGRILIDGRDMASVPARARGIGFVFQNYALFRHMTVAGNIGFGLRIRPWRSRPSRAEIARRVEELLELVRLPGLGGRYPDQLSGGQRQRVALARALAIEPRVLLLDEPFGALDATVRRELRLWLRGLHDRLGLTSLFVTHDQDEALELADRVAVMRDGRVVQCDTPEALLARPADAGVAGFLGDAARLGCEVRGGMAWFAALPPVPAEGVAEGQAVAFLRPVDLLAEPGEGEARVAASRQDGRGVRLTVAVGESLLEAVPAPGWQPRRGEACRVRVLAARVFPA
ncbi:sulfate/molybdate ABC transporter ATP-binding protein [Belnapia sp. T6]|uniref:Sulfate/molybdate ABC transporter ATP-binding protein n=1 Tax=Belnapia mucosa TaxID=2804532 RepID=A0ABS1UXN9_9PROT|nr:sulfate/molybdate ABC transporter ATP-binding protein [Belnapia mucosa]MBL6454243.1 sulfate/molybdate ABC transporter ATP-binding protein [Belnapia mucosa]